MKKPLLPIVFWNWIVMNKNFLPSEKVFVWIFVLMAVVVISESTFFVALFLSILI